MATITAPLRRTLRVPGNWLLLLVALYFVLLTAVLTLYGGWTTPDLYLPGLFFIAIVLGRGRRFVADWLPFLGLLLGYESLRSAVDVINTQVHWATLANIDTFLGFGVSPTHRLQGWFYRPGVNPLNVAVAVAYLLHFVAPVGLAFMLWLKDRRAYWRFTSALLLVSFAGYFTFLAFPAAPPWMAAQQGYLPPVHTVIPDTLSQIVHPGLVAFAWSNVGSNAVAPFPSLHAAWPMIVALAIATYFESKLGHWRWLLFLYPAFVGFAVIYGGEHYLIDVLAGYAYAAAAFFTVEWVARRAARRGQPQSVPASIQPAPVGDHA
ncbi:MAG: phosphatase PAP2 family protein [Tepidiformaceae bacterium]